MESQTGVDVESRDVRLLERLRFRPADGEETVSSWGVTFGAAVNDERFLRDPEIVDHPYLPAEHEQTFAWFDAVPEDANNNQSGPADGLPECLSLHSRAHRPNPSSLAPAVVQSVRIWKPVPKQ